jgi:hypothetical protein
MSGNWQFTSDVFNGEILTAEFADTSKVISPDEDEIYYAHAVNNDGHVLVVTTGEFLLLVFSRWKMSNDTALSHSLDGRFDFPGPEWREGDDALHLIRTGSIDKDPVIEEITLVGGPDGYGVAAHTRKNP